ncbi:radical SAM protein [Candidatus Uhrbacteria bacterium]|nr:radical SAM protein [Candidatus Uhrbacteria bacterium]
MSLPASPRESARWRSRTGPLGLHLFNRVTGTNVLLDEVRCPVEGWSRAPRSLSIALLDACDLSCSFCYAPKTVNRLGAAEVLAWTRELSENGTFNIGFGGGEPTLHPDFARICRDISVETGVAVSFTTHGYHLPKVAGSLHGSVNFIRVSMDGVGPTYERIRRRPFDQFLAALQVALTVSPVGVNYVVNADTLSELDDAADLVLRLGVRELLLLPQMDGGVPSLSAEHAARLSSWVAENHRHVPVRVSAMAMGLLGEDVPVLPVDEPDSRRQYLHIDAARTLKTCSHASSGYQIAAGESIMDAIDKILRSTQ